jgi:hypothetical protein
MMMALLCSEVVKVDRTATAAGTWSVRGAAQIHARARRRAIVRATIRADRSVQASERPGGDPVVALTAIARWVVAHADVSRLPALPDC